MRSLFVTAAVVLLPLMPHWSLSQDEEIDLQAQLDQYPGVDGVFLEYSRVLDHRKKSPANNQPRDWTFFAKTQFRYLVFNPDNEEWSTLKFELENGTRLSQCTIRIINQGEEDRVFSAGHLIKEQSDQKTNYKFAYPGVRKGSLVEVAYETQVAMSRDGKVMPPLYYDEPLQFEVPCKKLSFTFIYPIGWRVQVKRTNTDRKTLLKKREGPLEGTFQLSYDALDVPAVAWELLSPPYKELAQYTELEISSFQLPNVLYRGPFSWNDLGDRFKKYFIDNDGKFSIRSKRLAKELTRDIDDPLEKLDAIVTYVQQNISTDGGLDPGNFAKVLVTKSGNAVVNTALTLKLLKHAGLNGRFLMIHSAEDGFFDSHFVSYQQFYMPAVIVTIEDREYVVFPYIEDLPVNHTPEFLQGQAALQIAKNGFTTLTTVPAGNLAENDAEEFYDLTLNENGNIQVVEKKVLKGSFAFAARKSLRSLDPDEQDAAITNLLTYSEGDVKLQDKKLENLEGHRQPLVVTLTYEIANLLTVTPDEVLFNTGGLLAPISSASYRVSGTDRQHPIQIPFNISTRKHIRINYPASWRLTSNPEDVAGESEFGQAQSSYRREPQTLVIEQKVVVKRIRAPKEKYRELIEILGARLAIPHLFFEPISATASQAIEPESEKPRQ